MALVCSSTSHAATQAVRRSWKWTMRTSCALLCPILAPCLDHGIASVVPTSPCCTCWNIYVHVTRSCNVPEHCVPARSESFAHACAGATSMTASWQARLMASAWARCAKTFRCCHGGQCKHQAASVSQRMAATDHDPLRSMILPVSAARWHARCGSSWRWGSSLQRSELTLARHRQQQHAQCNAVPQMLQPAQLHAASFPRQELGA